MKNNSVSFLSTFFLIGSLLLGTLDAMSQVSSDVMDLRPFDFADKYYEENGILAATLTARKNGADGQSVFDTNNDPYFSNVRITATLPAYSAEGSAIYWNYYGGASKASFTGNAQGGSAVDLAYAYPVYVFPSTTVQGSDRQSAMIHVDGTYFEKNVLGIGAVMLVEYTGRIYTHGGIIALKALEDRNGVSLDGTPIIRTAAELSDLHANRLVTIRQASPENSGRAAFAIAKVMQYPERGAIAPDAFLDFIKQANGQPLAAERHFLTKFDCLKSGVSPCL